ncbi:hypothetical protein KA005_68275 [bacterium]|nr:hypothetical protein [bacterium]
MKFEEGANKFRIYPFHPDGGGTSYTEPKSVSFLPVKVPQRDAERKIIEGKFEVKRKPIFNAKVHGPFAEDPVEAYMQFFQEVAKQDLFELDADQKKAWAQITGQKGIKPSDTWVVYADKHYNDGTKEFGILDLKKSMKSQMTEHAAQLGGSDVAMPDPFSDPDDGICVIITKDSVAGKLDANKYYHVDLEKEKIDKFNFSLVPTPLSDADLETFMGMDSINKRYHNAYTRADFAHQIEGLQRFDEEQGYGIFAYDEWAEWLDTFATQVDETLPEESEEEEEVQEEPQAETKTTGLPFEVDEQDESSVTEAEIVEEEEAPKVTPRVVRKTTTTSTIKKKPAPPAAPTGETVQERMARIKKQVGK